MFSARGGFSGGSDALILTANSGPSFSGNTANVVVPGIGSYTIDWGDGNISNVSSTANHRYAQANTLYNIVITGNITGLDYVTAWNTNLNKRAIVDINSWGAANYTTLNFYGCNLSTLSTTEIPNFGTNANLDFLFAENPNFTDANIRYWNVAKVTSLAYAFYGCDTFNSNIGSWNVANVSNLRSTFAGVTNTPRQTIFNQNISSWNVANVVDMDTTFADNKAFNQPIGTWNTNNVTSMSAMFYSSNTAARSIFNQPIGTWNVANVTDMSDMFRNANTFNQNLTGWNTANVTNMSNMFAFTLQFNGNITNWNIANVTNMTSMFSQSQAFNSNITGWNTGNVINMANMFANALVFNQPIGTWNVSNVTFMSNMFRDADNFNQNLGTWQLRTGGVGMTNMLDDNGMNTENYSKTIIGWANWVSGHANTPAGVTLGANGRTYSNTVYTGTPYSNAVAARTYLDTGTPNWTITGDSFV